MPDYDLWVTDRCAADDLGLETWPGEDAVFGARDHEVVARFYEQRRQQPDGGDHVVCLRDERCYSLHIGRYRGVTWHDAENAVVFLLAVGWHSEGARGDAYEWVCELERKGVLYPTDDDYAALEAWRLERDMTRLRHEIGPELFARADAQPNEDFEVDLGSCRVAVRAVADGNTLMGYQLTVLSRGEVHAAGADRIAKAIAYQRKISFTLVNMPAWGSYVFAADLS